MLFRSVPPPSGGSSAGSCGRGPCSSAASKCGCLAADEQGEDVSLRMSRRGKALSADCGPSHRDIRVRDIRLPPSPGRRPSAWPRGGRTAGSGRGLGPGGGSDPRSPSRSSSPPTYPKRSAVGGSKYLMRGRRPAGGGGRIAADSAGRPRRQQKLLHIIWIYRYKFIDILYIIFPGRGHRHSPPADSGRVRVSGDRKSVV